MQPYLFIVTRDKKLTIFFLNFIRITKAYNRNYGKMFNSSLSFSAKTEIIRAAPFSIVTQSLHSDNFKSAKTIFRRDSEIYYNLGDRLVIRKSLVLWLPPAEIFMHRVQKTLFLLHFAILGLTKFHSKMIVLNFLVPILWLQNICTRTTCIPDTIHSN